MTTYLTPNVIKIKSSSWRWISRTKTVEVLKIYLQTDFVSLNIYSKFQVQQTNDARDICPVPYF